jgi:hypothetical protein
MLNHHIEKPKQLTPAERQAMFGGILGEMQMGGTATSQYAGILTQVQQILSMVLYLKEM